MAESKEKIIEAAIPDGQSFQVGDRVEVSIRERTGYFAVMIAFLVPVVLMILLLVTGRMMKWPDWISGMLALGGVLIYFPILHLMRSGISRRIHFYIRKIDE